MGSGTQSKIRDVIYAIGMFLCLHQEVGEVLPKYVSHLTVMEGSKQAKLPPDIVPVRKVLGNL